MPQHKIGLIVCLLLIGCQNDDNSQRHSIAMLDAVTIIAEPESAISLDSLPIERSTSCPIDMVEIQGLYCPLVHQICLSCLDAGKKGPPPWRSQCRMCAEFYPSQCLSSTKHSKHFCIDIYEWPNRKGQKPALDMSWNQSKAVCEGIGKRLCTESEWTFACEGENMHPYSYGDGYHRDFNACNSGHQWINPWYMRPGTKLAIGNRPISEVDQSVASGAFESCSSVFGVHDLVANADEWVRNEWVRSSSRKISILKGGHWVKSARNQCRPMTKTHPPDDHLYVTGTRCCADIH
jgi:hypothetical protein